MTHEYVPKNIDEARGIELTRLVNREVARGAAPGDADLSVLEPVGPNGRLLQGENAHTGFTYIIPVREARGRFEVYDDKLKERWRDSVD